MAAKEGNTNALKHGFYAKRFSPDEQSRISKIDEDLSHEIELLRIFVDRLADQLKDIKSYSVDDLAKLHLVATLATAVGTLTTRKAFMTGKITAVQDAIEEAIHARAPMWTKA